MPKKWEKKRLETSDIENVYYKNSVTPNLVKKITLIRTLDRRRFVIVVDVERPESSPQIRALQDELTKASFPQDTREARLRTGIEHLSNPDVFIKFFEILRRYESIDDEEYYEILSEIGIRKPEEDFAKEVSCFVEEGNFDAAIALAKKCQDDGYNEIIWELASGLHVNKSINFEKLIDLYQYIPESNPNYPDANGRLVVLFLEVDPDKYHALELAIDGAIKSKDQRLLDQLFHSLCGREDMKPTFTNMKGDTHTLISLATHIREVEGKLATLELEKNPEQKKAGFFK